MQKPDYGIDAPGVIRNLFIVAVAGISLYVTAGFGLWSGVIAHIDIAHSTLWPGLACGAMGCWMLYDSKIGKLKFQRRHPQRL